jgi:hypothetical protein
LILNGTPGLKFRNNRNSERKLQIHFEEINTFNEEGRIIDNVTQGVVCYRVG